MSTTHTSLPARKIPTRKDAMVFRFKTFVLQIRRCGIDLLDRGVARHHRQLELAELPVVAVSKTPLWTETEPQEQALLAGKIHNLRIAAKRLDGVEVPAGRIFSFWKHVGRSNRRRGFVIGRELREGCIVPNIGGGLCQMSNALYDAALQAGFEIVERHAHTQVIPGSLAEKGRDATVFWNYVDLRFRSATAFRIEASLDSDNLIVKFRGSKPRQLPNIPIIERRRAQHAANSCVTCEVADCHRNVPSGTRIEFGRTAYLLDEYSPEFDAYISANRRDRDRLFIPLDGERFKKNNYKWTTRGFASVRQSLFVTAKRSYRSRRLAAQGAARQRNLLQMYSELAASYARSLGPDVLHVVVQQKLLPFLWLGGCLGGRTFDVLANELPMAPLQTELDRAASLHPHSTTLGDFRADASLVEAESAALRAARKIITPHSKIASIFPARFELLEWKMPAPLRRQKPDNPKPIVVFPASTVGRKGCYELRDALEGMDVNLICLGPRIEEVAFWAGVDTADGDWLNVADLVVLPAFVEHRPRRLLQAAASNIPVIASDACGVEHVPNIHTVSAGDAEALREIILSLLPKRS